MTAIDTANLGNRLRAARELADLKQAELAERTGVSRSQIANLEAGRGDPSLSALLGISKATGVPIAALVGEAPMPELPRVRVIVTAGVACDVCGGVATLDNYPDALKRADEHRQSHIRGGAR